MLIHSPKISVIIPVYNVEKYLPECLDSVLGQTLKEIEVICVNDGSTDNSLEILNEYALRDERIVVLTQKNQKQGAARNAGLKIAKGEYVQFLDSDDWLRDDACEQLYNHARQEGLDMLSFSGWNVNNETRVPEVNKYWAYSFFPPKFNFTSFMRSECAAFFWRFPVSAGTTIYRREFIRKNKLRFPEGLYFEDALFFTQALFMMSRMGINREKFYYRRVHGASTTQNWEKHYADYLEIMSRVLDFVKKNATSEIYNKYRAQYCSGCRTRYKGFSDEYKAKYAKQLESVLKKYEKSSLGGVIHRYYLFGIPLLRVVEE